MTEEREETLTEFARSHSPLRIAVLLAVLIKRSGGHISISGNEMAQAFREIPTSRVYVDDETNSLVLRTRP